MTPLPLFDKPLPRLPRRLLPMLLMLALADQAAAQTATVAQTIVTDPVCPVGILRCAKPTNPYAQCKRNDLLDFFTAGLPPAGDRSKAKTDATADHVTRRDDSHQLFEGNVEIQRLDALLKTDSLLYNTDTTDYVASGHVRYQDASLLLSADHARGTTTPSVTYLDNVRYQLLDQRGNGVAASINETDPDHSKMLDGSYSTCDPSDRQWDMRSKDMEIDQVQKEGHGHNVTMYYNDVPFFWFPYLSWPIDEERHSGFLAPIIGYSEKRGLKLGIPYYFNLAPNYDLTLKPVEFTDRGPMLDGEFRYISDWDRLLVEFGYMPHDDITGDSRGYLRLQDWTTVSPNWDVTVDIHHVSDDEYLHDYGDSFETTAVALLQSSVNLFGHGDWWHAAISGDTWEVTDPSLESRCNTSGVALRDCTSGRQVYVPYTRFPHVTFDADKLLGGFDVGVHSEYVNFQRIYSITGQRVDAYPYIAYPIETAGFFLRPELGYRVTAYDLSNLIYDTSLKSSSPSRTMPIASIDSGLTFERDTQLFGTAYTQTLEPRLFYLYVPYRNQSNLPVFDTSLPSFDLPSLFRTNLFSGADRQVNANNLTVALTSRLIDAASGDQLLSASVGQIRYFSTVKVQLPYTSDLNITGQDIIGELDLRVDKNWDLIWDQQWNPHPQTFNSVTGFYDATDHHTDLSSIGIQHRFGADGVINFNYNFRRGLLEQYDFTTKVPLNSRWSLVGRYYYSLMDKRLLETFGGVQYDSCCVAARAIVRRYINDVQYNASNQIINTKPDTALFFEIEFKGLGATGQRTENYLRRGIIGYQ